MGSPGHTAQHSPLGIVALGQSTWGQSMGLGMVCPQAKAYMYA